MILGIGIDLLNADRIKKLYQKYSEKILHKILSDIEIDYLINKRKNVLNFLSRRFCVKEAFCKAIGTGFGKYVGIKSISCINDEYGKPYIICDEKLIKFIEDKFSTKFDKISIDISISDDKPFVNAFVIISTRG